MNFKRGEQLIKTRDDIEPIAFQRLANPQEVSKPFTLKPGQHCTWANGEEPFGVLTLRQRIEPWLTALVQSEHLSLLLGSGLTHAVHQIATGRTLDGMQPREFDEFSQTIKMAACRISNAANRHAGNFEDVMRVASELLRGLEILSNSSSADDHFGCRESTLRDEITDCLRSFAEGILLSERELLAANPTDRARAFQYLVNFLLSFASRSGTRDRLSLYTTNYDRFIEAGADTAGLRLIDRFVGTLSPVFRASRLDIDYHYNPPGIRGEPRFIEGVVRYTKLHGSVDWIDSDGSIRRVGLPLGASNIHRFLEAAGGDNANALQLMVYPNSAKDRETASYPYVELFRDFATSICRPNSTLICYGYGFGDEHINRVIEDMLTIPSTHLVVISYDDPLCRILNSYSRLGKPAQISLMIGNHFGDLTTLVDRYLPKSAIDRTTIRMADLLKTRWTTALREAPAFAESQSGEGS